MHCLVTGVAGFIGSHLAEQLISDGHDVLGIDAFTDYYPRSHKEANLAMLRTAPRFRFLEGDLNTLDLTAALADCEWVFHQAAQAGVVTSWSQRFDTYTACNINATQRLLEASIRAPRLRRLVYASSSSVYGNVPTLPVTEETLTRPVSPYGVTKLAAEHLCNVYFQAYQVPTVSLRYFSVYGPRQRPDMAFHRFGKALVEGSELQIFGDGEQTRDFTYVSDIVAANLCAAEAPDAPGKVFNIAGGSRVTVREVLNLLEQLSGRTARICFNAAQPGDVRDTLADTSYARDVLRYAPRVSLSKGLAAELMYLQTLYMPKVTAAQTCWCH